MSANRAKSRWEPAPSEKGASASGRGRNRRLLGAVGSSLVSRSVGLAAPLILVPYAIQVLGVESYGLWSAITSLTAMAVFADLGLGNGLMTRLTESLAGGQLAIARQQISSAYIMVIGVALLVLVAALTAWALGASRALLTASDVPQAEADVIFLACTIAFALNLPAMLIQRVQYASQDISYSNIWQAAGSLASVAAFVTADRVGAQPTTCLVVSVLAVPATGALNTAAYFLWKRRDLNPIFTKPRTIIARRLAALGSQFLILSVVTSVAQNIDPVLIARSVGLGAVAQYAVAFKLMSSLLMLVALVNTPLWPLNGEALAKGDIQWVRRTTKVMSAGSALLVALGALAMLWPLQGLLTTWLGSAEAMPSRNLQMSLALWCVILAATSAVFMVQNAAGVVWPQLIGWTAFLICSVPMKMLVLDRSGVDVVPLAGAGLFLITVLPSAVFGRRLALVRAQRSSTAGASVALLEGGYSQPGEVEGDPAIPTDRDKRRARSERRI